jgi:hypothetical protein
VACCALALLLTGLLADACGGRAQPRFVRVGAAVVPCTGIAVTAGDPPLAQTPRLALTVAMRADVVTGLPVPPRGTWQIDRLHSGSGIDQFDHVTSRGFVDWIAQVSYQSSPGQMLGIRTSDHGWLYTFGTAYPMTRRCEG